MNSVSRKIARSLYPDLVGVNSKKLLPKFMAGFGIKFVKRRRAALLIHRRTALTTKFTFTEQDENLPSRL